MIIYLNNDYRVVKNRTGFKFEYRGKKHWYNKGYVKDLDQALDKAIELEVFNNKNLRGTRRIIKEIKSFKKDVLQKIKVEIKD